MTRAHKKVSLVIATYHGAQFVHGWSESIKMQTYPINEVIVIDNSVTPETDVELRKVRDLPMRIFLQKQNLDFAAGYNLGMEETSGDYILILNQDVLLDSRAVEELVTYMDAHPHIGAASPALLRFGSTLVRPVIDSLGITLSRSRTYTNIQEGKATPLPIQPCEVFALTGAAICFRREALDALDTISGEYFDPLFVSYKEDIDISYRLRHAGYALAVVPQSIVFHKRTAQEVADMSLTKRRAQKSFRIRSNSLKNQWWVLLKNEPWSNLIMHAPWIFLIELMKFCYICIMEPSTLRILPTTCMQLPLILKKRSRILRSSRISARDIRSWI